MSLIPNSFYLAGRRIVKTTIFVTSLFTFATLAPRTAAAGPTTLPVSSDLLKLRSTLNAYLDVDPELSFSQMRAITDKHLFSFSAAEIALEAIKPKLGIELQVVQTRVRVVFDILEDLVGMKSHERLRLTDSQREILRQRLTPLLEAFDGDPALAERTAAIFNAYELWTPAEFWFIRKRLDTLTHLVHYRDAIVHMSEDLPPEYRSDIVAAVRGLKPLALEQQLLLYTLGALNGREYEDLFLALQRLFLAPLVAQPGPPRYEVSAYERHTENLAIDVLRDLQGRYWRRESEIVQAYVWARDQATLAVAVNFYRKFAEVEFKRLYEEPYFKANRPYLRELDPLLLKSYVPKLPPPDLVGHPNVFQRSDDGKVVHASFGGTCAKTSGGGK